MVPAKLAAMSVILTISVAAGDGCQGSLPPGFTHFTHGYDLSTIDPLNPLDLGYKHNVLQTSCTNASTYINDYNQQKYVIPDQLDGPPINIGGASTDFESIVTSDSQSFAEHISYSLGISGFLGMMSGSASMQEAASLLAQEYVYTSSQSSHVASYEMDLHPAFRKDVIKLHEDCQYLVDRLPKQFDSSSFDSYEQLIEECGTHFLTSARLGGKFQVRHFIGSGKLDVMASEEVEANVKLSFLFFLSLKGAGSAGARAASDNFLAISTNYSDCFGGDACPTSPETYKDWEKSVATIPAFVSGKFAPISGLIDDKTVAVSFDRAVSNHFNRAFLQNELIPLFQATLKTLQNFPVNYHKTVPNCVVSPDYWCPNCGGNKHGAACSPSIKCKGSTASNPYNYLFGNEPFMILHNLTASQNHTSWTSRISNLIAQAKAALLPKLVSNATVEVLAAEYAYYILHIQMPLAKETCGWHFGGYTKDFWCADCHSTVPPGCPSTNSKCGTNITQNSLTYLKGLIIGTPHEWKMAKAATFV